jgi:hypothetical protein
MSVKNNELTPIMIFGDDVMPLERYARHKTNHAFSLARRRYPIMSDMEAEFARAAKALVQRIGEDSMQDEPLNSADVLELTTIELHVLYEARTRYIESSFLEKVQNSSGELIRRSEV